MVLTVGKFPPPLLQRHVSAIGYNDVWVAKAYAGFNAALWTACPEATVFVNLMA